MSKCHSFIFFLNVQLFCLTFMLFWCLCWQLDKESIVMCHWQPVIEIIFYNPLFFSGYRDLLEPFMLSFGTVKSQFRGFQNLFNLPVSSKAVWKSKQPNPQLTHLAATRPFRRPRVSLFTWQQNRQNNQSQQNTVSALFSLALTLQYWEAKTGMNYTACSQNSRNFKMRKRT